MIQVNSCIYTCVVWVRVLVRYPIRGTAFLEKLIYVYEPKLRYGYIPSINMVRNRY
jgi:hypothetical protein